MKNKEDGKPKAYVLIVGQSYNDKGKNVGVRAVTFTPKQWIDFIRLDVKGKTKFLVNTLEVGSFGVSVKKYLSGRPGTVYEVPCIYDKEDKNVVTSIYAPSAVFQERIDIALTRKWDETERAVYGANRVKAMTEKDIKISFRDRMTWEELKNTYRYLSHQKKAAMLTNLVLELSKVK